MTYLHTKFISSFVCKLCDTKLEDTMHCAMMWEALFVAIRAVCFTLSGGWIAGLRPVVMIHHSFKQNLF